MRFTVTPASLKFNFIASKVKLMNYFIFKVILFYIMISTKKISKRCNVRVILWIIHFKLLVSLSVTEKDKRLKRIWIRSLSVIGIL